MTATYVAAGSIDEVLSALASGARPIAGGTDLVVGHRSGKAPLPEKLVAIHELDELRSITESAGAVSLGALVNHERITQHPAIRSHHTALADASAIVGSHATRNAGTIGGNVMNASPAMETGGPLMCLGATVTLRSANGERSVAVDELFTGPGKTVANADEMLIGGRGAGTATGYGIVLRTARIPSPDGDRDRRGNRRCHLRGRDDLARQDRDYGAGSDHPARAGGRSGVDRHRRGARCTPSRSRRCGDRLPPDLRHARYGRLPAGDGRRDHTAGDHRRGRPRARYDHSYPREPGASRRHRVTESL